MLRASYPLPPVSLCFLWLHCEQPYLIYRQRPSKVNDYVPEVSHEVVGDQKSGPTLSATLCYTQVGPAKLVLVWFFFSLLKSALR